MEKPTPARQAEFAEALDFIDQVFRPGQAGRFVLKRNYPHAYRPEYARRILLQRDQGNIVGCLAIHPLTIRMAEARLVAGGIGAVGTDPQRRGEGIMGRLLQAADTHMRRAGYPLSVLWGDRQRYGWFGWEKGGIRNSFTLCSRQLGRPSAAERRLRLEHFVPSPALCRRLQRLERSQPYGVERPLRDIAPLFHRLGRQTWICREGKRIAYLALQREGRQRHGAYETLEEAGGDTELIRSMLRLLFAREGLSRLQAGAGPNPDQIEALLPISSNWARECACMLKILDLPLLLTQVQPLVRRLAASAGVRGRFNLLSPCPRGQLDLGPGGHHRLEMSDQDLVALLFGLHPLAEHRLGAVAAGVLARVLPLPLFIPSNNYI